MKTPLLILLAVVFICLHQAVHTLPGTDYFTMPHPMYEQFVGEIDDSRIAQVTERYRQSFCKFMAQKIDWWTQFANKNSLLAKSWLQQKADTLRRESWHLVQVIRRGKVQDAILT